MRSQRLLNSIFSAYQRKTRLSADHIAEAIIKKARNSANILFLLKFITPEETVF